MREFSEFTVVSGVLEVLIDCIGLWLRCVWTRHRWRSDAYTYGFCD
jgi:hypothetical protein